MSENTATDVRVAIVGVGNCASSLVQGVQYYQDADENSNVPGLMHVKFGPYHVRDVKFVAAFDVDAKKVGFDLSEAINSSENNTIKICDVPPTGIVVQRGHTLDGLGKDAQLTVHPGVQHAFFNDHRPEVYAAAEAEVAWETTISFLSSALG